MCFPNKANRPRKIARDLRFYIGAPDTIRTYDTRFRRAVLYPLSYGGDMSSYCNAYDRLCAWAFVQTFCTLRLLCRFDLCAHYAQAAAWHTRLLTRCLRLCSLAVAPASFWLTHALYLPSSILLSHPKRPRLAVSSQSCP